MTVKAVRGTTIAREPAINARTQQERNSPSRYPFLAHSFSRPTQGSRDSEQLRALFSRTSPNRTSAGEELPTLTGMRNQSQLNNPFQAVLGKTKIFPTFISDYWTELDNKTSGRGKLSLYGLLCFGYGELSLQNFKIGDRLFINNDGDMRNGEVEIPRTNPIQGDLEIRQDGTLPKLYNARRKMVQVNSQLQHAPEENQRVILTTPRGVISFSFIYRFNGLFHETNRRNGVMVGLTISYRRIKREEDSEQPDWIHRPISRHENTFDLLRFEEIVTPTDEQLYDNPTRQWEVCVWRSSPDTNDDMNDTLFWDSAVFTFEDRSKGIESSEKSPNDIIGSLIRRRELKRLCLVAFRIEANELTQGLLDKFSAEAQLVAPILENGSWTSDDDHRPTSNPAAIYRYMLRGPYMNEPADDDQIDYDALNELYKFCEENDYKCNGMINEKMPFQEAIGKVLATARSTFFIKNGEYSVSIDNNGRSEPVAIISPKNSSNFVISRQFGTPIAGYKVNFYSRKHNWAKVQEDVYPIERMEGEYPIFAEPEDGDYTPEIFMWGVDNREQASRIALYMLASNELRREIYTCRISIEHFALSKGDRVFLAHDALSIGIANGYIQNIEGRRLTLDEMIDVDLNKEYGIQIRLFNEDAEQEEIDTIPVERLTMPQTNVTLLRDPKFPIKRGDFYAFGEMERITEDCIILAKQIEPSPSMAATLTLTAYAPEIFEADRAVVPPFDPNITETNFDTSLIFSGHPGVRREDNGSSVRDEGAIYYDLSEISRTSDNFLFNHGALGRHGNGILEDIALGDDNEVFRYATPNPEGGYIKCLTDVTFYRSFTITFWLKGELTEDRAIIASFLDDENAVRFEIFSENRELKARFNNVFIPILDITPQDLKEGVHIAVSVDRYTRQIHTYKNAELNTVDWSQDFYDEGVIPADPSTLEFRDEGLISDLSDNPAFDDEGLINPEVLDVDRDQHFYLFQDKNGEHRSHFAIARFHLYAQALSHEAITSLYERNYFAFNIATQTTFLGELERPPLVGFFYDYFKYVGNGSDKFFLPGHFYRRIEGGWELFNRGAIS